MPTYNFTSDLRISVLPERIQAAATEIINNELSTDKSASNNRATLAFYFNLVDGTNTLKLAANGSITEVVRNFVLKFQFPNTYTADIFNKNIEEHTMIAPLRETVKLLAYQYLFNGDQNPYLTYDEIKFFVFGNPDYFKGASADDYKAVLSKLNSNRSNNHDYTTEIEHLLNWKQYDRQSRELISIIPYACDAFKTSSGKLILSMPNPLSEKFADVLHFIASAMKENTMWIPADNVYNQATKDSYIEYMDINGDVELCRQANPLNDSASKSPLNEPLQQIFFGAPGTGKSFKINEMCAQYENYRTTFHPDTDYATFVGSYKPITKPVIRYDIYSKPLKDENGKDIYEDRIVYRYVFQSFLKAYIAAWKEQQNPEPKPVFLVIEEINRGNCAQIFGDIFQLLDRNESGYSDYPIVADDDLAQELKREFEHLSVANPEAINALYKGGKDVVGSVKDGICLLLPNNLYIWATMNTSDQSLFPIDSAFKRRWDWKYIKIKDNAKNYKIVFSNGNVYDWWEFVNAINDKIENGEIQQEDKKLGYFFAKSKDGKISADRFLSKVIFYLYNDVFKDFGFDEDFFKGADGKPMTFASYFDEAGDADENQIERFLTNLKLKPDNIKTESSDHREE